MDHDHPQHLASHFDTPTQQSESGKLGMWLFLATEVLLFGGLFCAYAVYRAGHPEVFVYASQYLDRWLGGLNTIILICSSLTMAWAVRCAQSSQRRGLIINLAMTLVFAFGFLGVKAVEYEHKWKHGLLPGKHFAPVEHDQRGGPATQPVPTSTPATTPADARPTLPRSNIPRAPEGPPGLGATALPAADQAARGTQPANVRLFFSIYFLMTGLHGLHVIAGMIVITWLLARSVKGHFSADYFAPVDLGGLYWHLVDVIWIYLFPLLYLIH